ncbi:cadherin repeat domain-containing protein, partial [Colwellia piezophila]|uniref:cadherin repeat domain-containing protein n=1 Tax=Colwellia piezophila TaxID=211668 RepID=UPI0003644BFD
VGDTTATSAPTVTITTDTDNNEQLSNVELGNSTTVNVVVGIPADAVKGDTLTVSGQAPIVLTQDQIDAKELSFDYARPADGQTLTVTASLTDVAGNTSATASDTATVGDTTAPVLQDNQQFQYSENQIDIDKPVATVVFSQNVAEAAPTFTFTETGTTSSKDGLFTINSAGEVHLTNLASEANNFETGAIAHSYNITSTDASGNASKADITLTETNVNEAPEVDKESTDYNTTTNTFEFEYNEGRADTDILGRVVTTDQDANDTVSYSITAGNDDGYFAINNDGEITLTPVGVLAAANDYETLANVHALTVTAKDADNATTEIKVELTEKNVIEGVGVILSAPTSVNEGEKITYTVKLTEAVADGKEVTVTLDLTDSNNQPVTITIIGGQSEGSVSIDAPSDDVYVDTETLNVSIVNATGGDVETFDIDPNPAVILINDDNDTVTVKLTAVMTGTEDGGSIVYTASLEDADGNAVLAKEAITVTLENGEQITIAINSSSEDSVAVAVNEDDVYSEADAAVSNNIKMVSTADTFENLVADKTVIKTAIADDIDNTTVSLSADKTELTEAGGTIT